MTAQAAWAEIKIVRLEKETVHGLCVVTAELPSIHGLKNTQVQRQLNHILFTEVENQYLHFLKDLETDPFCKESVGTQTSIWVVAHLLSENLISIVVRTTGDRNHPWYELKTYNFDPDTGKKYSLRDLIPEDAMAWLKERIKTEIENSKKQKVDDLPDFRKRYFYEYLEMFFIEKDEIVFDFNTRLFGHADGGADARIKLREVASKLPKDSLLFKLATKTVR
jgi:hypothetical protein